MFQIKLAAAHQAPLIETVARPIWQQHYVAIIGEAQVEYMLQKFQSTSAIKAQMQQGMDYYLVYRDEQPVGYFAISNKIDSLFISKFYLNLSERGRGMGKKMLEKIEHIAKADNCKQLELTVNKYNPAFQIYLKLGFEKCDSIKVDIGNGYFMDDYVLVKSLTDNRT